ncbi:DUF2125 domain-containing protein [Yoonia sp.]|uniref:DUF2125 domain-containing protein n=1 Tax=Yoonia sp. TaxID=2212373 RepID=UPI003F6A8CD1
MTYINGMRGAACIAALFAGGVAQADVTAAQVWEDWKAQLALYGEDSVSIGSEETSAGTVTVRDLALSTDDGQTTVAVVLGDLVFSERGDGTVSVAMADSYPITIVDEDGVVITAQVSQSGLDMIVGGNPDDLRYDISADRYEIALLDVVNGDITFTGDVSAIANDITGTYTSSTAEMRNITYALDVTSLELLVDVQVPGDDGGYVTASGQINDMGVAADISIPLDADLEDPDTLISDGFAVAGGYTIGNAAYVFDIEAEGDRVAGSISTGAGRLDATLNAETVAYDAQTTDIAVNLSVPDLPFPVEFGLAEYGLGFAMPVAQSEDPADFSLNLDLIDLTVNGMIWDMFDPGSVLPRDPATIQLDVTGTATPMFDLMDPAQADAIDDAAMPVALNSMTLKNLRIALAGALITGSGNFTFDNSDLQTFDGMPRPEGEALIEIIGLNGLMDNLATMGLIPQDQIMGGRMMLGMFARATGDDQLESRVQVNAEGQVIVNGQRLR